MMNIQQEFTTIKRTLAQDLKNGGYKNGYVKVCGSWVKRLWGIDKD